MRRRGREIRRERSVALCPDEDRVGHVAERLVHRDDDRADNVRRESHIEAEVNARRKRRAAAGGGMKPTASPVASARGALTIGARSVEKGFGKKRREGVAKERRIEMHAERLAAEPRVERDACMIGQTLRRFLPNRPKPSTEREPRRTRPSSSRQRANRRAWLQGSAALRSHNRRQFRRRRNSR